MRLRHRLLIVAWALCLPLPLRAAPSDVVPLGDIAYDLLGSLSAAGHVPGHTLRDFLRGDRLYTRAELARIIADSRAAAADLEPERAFALAALEREFAPELRMREPEFALSPLPRETGALTAAFKLRHVTNPDRGPHIARVAGAVPVGRDGYAAVSVGSYRREGFSGDPARRYPAVESAFLRVEGRLLDVTLGVRPLRWGPGYYGPLLFSDAAPAVTRLQVEKGFRLPGTLGRRIGRLYFTQFAGQFLEEDVPDAPPTARGKRRYLLGRRIETAGGGRWTLSLEDGFKSARLPDPHWAFLLPFYSYQHEWTETNRPRYLGFLVTDPQPDTFWLNYVAAVGLSYRADARGTTLFGHLLVDDREAPPGLGLGDRVERKMGAQVGVHLPDLGGAGRYGARLEFSTVDAATYTNLSRPIEWFRNGLPLGFPAGPNARVVFGRLDARVTPRLHVAVDASARRRTSDNEPGPNVDALGLYATYALQSNAFVGARLDRRRFALDGQPAETRTRLEVNAGIGF